MKNIIFDFDGTIADTFVLAKEILNKLAPKYGYKPFSDDDIFDLRRKSLSEIVKEYHISRFNLLRMVWDAQREIAKNLGSISSFPGLPEVLRQLHEDGNYLAIISTNSKKNIQTFLSHNEIDVINDVSTSLNPFGKAKLVRKYLNRENFVPENAIYIGDEVRDFDTAQGAEVASILVSWGYNSKEVLGKTGAKVVNTPEELLAAIKELS